MLIMGVDPGSSITGYGIVDKQGVHARHVASGVIRVARYAAQSKRLWEIYRQLDEVVEQHRPEILVVESLFHANNSQSLMKLSQARGVVLLLGERHGMEIVEYSPAEIKQGITGYGRADKDQMIFMVAKILTMPTLKLPDEADALAMALFHSHQCRPEQKRT
jgi:crossover junction endodeoxyribonuclease RuvC